MRPWVLPTLLLVTLGVASCATPARDPFIRLAGSPVWPAPPEPPRVEYITSIRSHEDLFTQGGMWSALLQWAVGKEESGLVRPFAVAVHPGGGVLVADTGISDVRFYDLPNREVHSLAREIAGGLPSPVGVAALPDGSILVSDSRLGGIEHFGPDGDYLGRFAADYSFRRSGGIATDLETGVVYAVDVLAHQVAVFDSAGQLQRTIGGNGDAPGQFNFPTHIALDPGGNLLVADSMNFRIQQLTPRGEAIAVYGEAGNARGNFARVKGVACVRDDVFVAVEALYDSLVFFNGAGELLLAVGGAGPGPGEFWLPAGVAMDRERNLLFVADSYNSRIQVFRLETDAARGEP